MHQRAGVFNSERFWFGFAFSYGHINLHSEKVAAYIGVGDSDPITPTSLVIDYYEIIMSDKKEMIVIKNAGHTPFLDKPEQFCEAVKTFLSECENE